MAWTSKDLAVRYTEEVLDRFEALNSISAYQKGKLKTGVHRFFERYDLNNGAKAMTIAVVAMRNAFEESRESAKIPKYVGTFGDILSVIESFYQKRVSENSVRKLMKKYKEQDGSKILI